MLSTRILTALVLIPLVLAGLFLLSPRAWGAISLLVIAVAAHEWSRLVHYRGLASALFVLAVVATGALLLFAPAFGFEQGWPEGVVLGICGIATVFWLAVVPAWLRGHWRAAASARSRAAAAVVGWIVLIGAWVAVVSLQAQSAWRVLAAMAIVWIADTAAYFAGRTFGRHKLAPAISPGKTWEGVAGGLAAVAIYAVILARSGYDASDMSPASFTTLAAGLAIAVAALSVCGDLFESLLKRQAGVKDSGHLLPGHGGVLDRIDALLAAMPPLALAIPWLLR